VNVPNLAAPESDLERSTAREDQCFHAKIPNPQATRRAMMWHVLSGLLVTGHHANLFKEGNVLKAEDSELLTAAGTTDEFVIRKRDPLDKSVARLNVHNGRQQSGVRLVRKKLKLLKNIPYFNITLTVSTSSILTSTSTSLTTTSTSITSL
jgi:hypothetical protein